VQMQALQVEIDEQLSFSSFDMAYQLELQKT
jgi:hypothetical protein